MYGILVHVTTNILSSWNLSKLNQIFQQLYLLERLESENLILVMPCLVHLSLLKVPLELRKRTRQKQWNLSLRQVLKTTLTLKLHRCWWRMLETKCVGENHKILVTVRNSVTNSQKSSPTLSHQYHCHLVILFLGKLLKNVIFIYFFENGFSPG